MRSFGLVRASAAFSRRWIATAMAIVLGVAVSAAAFTGLRANEARAIEERVRQAAELRAEAVRNKLDGALASVRAVRALYESSESVSRGEFNAVAGRLRESSSALEAIEFVPKVTADDRGAYERLARPEGNPGFGITELDADGKLVPADRRDVYFPITYSVSADSNARRLGYDLGSDADQLSLLTEAGDAGREAASSEWPLLRRGKHGFAVVIPIYEQGAAKRTIRQRRNALVGYAVAVLSPESILDGAIGASQAEGMETMLVDQTGTVEELLAYRDSAGGRLTASVEEARDRMERAGARHVSEFPLGLGGHSLVLVVAPTPESTTEASTWLPWGGLALGLAVTALLALRLANVTARRARIEKLVEDRTAELRKANASLRETGDQLRALVEASPLAILSLDLGGRVISWSQAAERLFGWSAIEVIGRPLPTVPEDRRTEFDAYRHRSLEGNEVLQVETQQLRRDGSLVDVEVYIAPLYDEREQRSGHMTVIADITERKRVEEALRESEERFRTAFDEAAVGMAITGLDGSFRRVNRALSDITGYPVDELLQRRFRDITHPDDVEENVGALQRFVESDGRVLRMEKRYVHRSGDEIWVLLNIALVRDASGAPLYFVTEIQDITDWRRAVQALRESEERFRLMADSAPALAWMSDADGRPAFYNRGWLDFTGRTLEEELAQPLSAIHPDDVAAAKETFAASIVARTSWEAEYRLRRYDGAYRWISDWAVPRFLPDGSYAGLTGVAVDITERKQAEEERDRLLAYEREQVERLRELDGIKDDLVATVSHELRTPLTNILGYINVAQGVISEDEGRRLLSVIERNAKRLLDLVNDLLVVAQVDSGKLSIQRDPVDLATVVRESVESARAAAELKGLQVLLEPQPVTGFLGDQGRLVQLVDNLVGNAIKFTPAGGRVTVRVGAHEGLAFLEVEDSGIGIAATDLDRLFERFYRTADARQQAVQGTGLGLTIVRAIAEAHGGSVTVRSTPGEGATFRVELPLPGERRAAA